MKLNMLELGTTHLGWVELGTIKKSVCALFLSHNFELCLIPSFKYENMGKIVEIPK